MAVAERFEADGSAAAKRLALDLTGNVIDVSEDVRELLGRSSPEVAHAPGAGPDSWLAHLQRLAERSFEKARDNPSWRGSIDLGPPFTERPETYLVTPVFGPTGLVGWLLTNRYATSRSDSVVDVELPDVCCGVVRIAAVAEDSVLLLEPNEIRFAEADRHFVWLVTDHGRFRAVTKGMQNLERELARHGFVRVHRSFLINPTRVRRVDHKGQGVITLSTDRRRVENIPVSRRYTPTVRRLLGI